MLRVHHLHLQLPQALSVTRAIFSMRSHAPLVILAVLLPQELRQLLVHMPYKATMDPAQHTVRADTHAQLVQLVHSRMLALMELTT